MHFLVSDHHHPHSQFHTVSTRMSDSYTYKGSGVNSQVKHSRIDSLINSYLHYPDRAITGAVGTTEVLQATQTHITIATVSVSPSSPR